MEEIVQDSKRVLSAKKESEKKYKQEIGRPNRDVLPKIEKILQRHRIEKPYYHGGLYNGKAMNKLMTSSRKIMEDIRGMLMEIASEARCNDEEVSDTMEKFTNILSVFDALFSLARTPSGLMNGDKVATLQNLSNLALRLWRGLELSITPKVHAIEDHLVPQIIRFDGIGDLGEDFVERSHQDGIRQHSRSRNCKERVDEANQHCRWEHKRMHPAVMDKARAMEEQSIRRRKNVDENGAISWVDVSKMEEKMAAQAEDKTNIRSAAYIAVTNVEGIYLTSGRQRNIEDARQRLLQGQAVLETFFNRLKRNRY